MGGAKSRGSRGGRRWGAGCAIQSNATMRAVGHSRRDVSRANKTRTMSGTTRRRAAVERRPRRASLILIGCVHNGFVCPLRACAGGARDGERRAVFDARGAESFYGCVRTALSMEEMNRIARTQRSDQTWHEKITPAGAWAARTHAYRTAYAAPPRRVNGSGKYRD